MPESSPRPNEAFFNSQPAAREIRRLAIVAIGACLARLHGDNQPATTGELFGAESALQQWNIVADMHVKRDDEVSPAEMQAHQNKIRSNPRWAAEYVAGQFLTYLQIVPSLSGPEKAVLDEHDILDENQRHMPGGVMARRLDMATAPEAVRRYGQQFEMLTGLLQMLDYDGPRPHDEALARGEPYHHPLLHDE